MEQRKHVDFVSALIFLAISIFMIFSGIGYHNQLLQRVNVPFVESPGLLPVIVGSGLLVCSIMLLKRSMENTSIKEIAQKIKEGTKAISNKQTLYTLVGIALLGAYIYIIIPLFSAIPGLDSIIFGLGFLIGTIIFLIGIMLYLKATSLFKISIISIVFVIILYILVRVVFNAPLP